MKLLDEKMRLFGLVNPVDLVVALLVIAMAVGAYMFLSGKGLGNKDQSGTVEMVLLAQNLPKFENARISEGDIVTRVGGTGEMGKVVSVRFEPAVRETVDSSATLHVTESNVYQDVYITVIGPGSVTKTSANVGDEIVRVNQVMDVQFPLFKLNARVLELDQVK